jgi:secreted trypsin-like serine protease
MKEAAVRRLGVLMAVGLLLLGLGQPAAGIVGGQPVDVGQAPWTVAVGNPLLFFRPGGEICGGTRIAPTKVVTAAHCVVALRSVPWLVAVTTGRTDLTRSGGTRISVRAIWVHPQFRIGLLRTTVVNHNDVAVLTLARAVDQPTLPLVSRGDSTSYRPGTVARILGWGSTGEGGTGSNVLREAQVPIVSDQDCTTAFGGSYAPAEMTCAGLPGGGVDTCEFDSGGPLAANGRLIGITSWGIGCGRPGSPGMYTRLSSYADLVGQQ